MELWRERSPRDPTSQEARSTRLCQCTGQTLAGEGVLPSEIDEALRRPDGVGSDGGPFDQKVRVPFQDRPVLEGPRLPFLRVGPDELLVARSLSDRSPLPSCGKTR